MKKRKIMNKIDDGAMQNPVAKFAHQFNQAKVLVSKTEYRRKAKHANQDLSPVIQF